MSVGSAVPVHATSSFPLLDAARAAWSRRAVRQVLLLVTIAVSTPLALSTSLGESRSVAVWPVSALAVGLVLDTPRRRHAPGLAALLVVLVGTRLALGAHPVLAVGLGVSAIAEIVVIAQVLTRRGTVRPTLLLEGDVSRMIGAVAVGSGVAALGSAATNVAAGLDSPVLSLVSVFGTHAAGALVLLPLFLRTPRFPALAAPTERILQTVILLGTTALVFSVAPPVFFAVIPMFSWLAFRGTLRQSTLLIAVVAASAIGLTLAGVGPVAALEQSYDLAPELVNGVLQLFLIDAAIILLPLTALLTQQRIDGVELARRQQTLERIVASATQTAIITTDLDGRIQVFNPGAEAILGAAAEEAVGRSFEMFVTADELTLRGQELGTAPTFAAVAEEMVSEGPTRRLWRLARADGEQRTVQLTLNPLEGEDDDGFLLTAEDVTEREAARQALLSSLENEQRAVESLRELDQVKSDFVATVSHELRTPIANILGYVEVLLDNLAGDLTDHQRDVVGRVDRNGQRLQVLIEDLLLISHIERTGLVLHPADVDLREVVGAAHEETRGLLPGRLLEIDVELPAEPVAHCADGRRLQRVVANLLSNAVKFTPDGGRVWVRLEADADHSRVVVGDTGVGIPAEEQARMLSRFFRSSTSMTQAVPGAGLGLTLVRAILEEHGGRLEIASTPGEGTVVTAVVPRTVVPRVVEPAVEPVVEPEPGAAAPATGPGYPATP